MIGDCSGVIEVTEEPCAAVMPSLTGATVSDTVTVRASGVLPSNFPILIRPVSLNDGACFGDCKGNSQNSNILTLQLCNSCDTLRFLQLCAIIHLKSHTKSQHLSTTPYVLHIVYPYHAIPLSISVPRYCHPIPPPSCFTYYFQYFLYFIFSPYLSFMIHCWLLCTLFLM